jgi:uncharacterized protein YjbI with pentapeptide repeats
MTDEDTFRTRRRGPWIAAVVVGALLVVAGVWLWLSRKGDSANANTDLGSALLGSAVVAFAVLFLQWRFELDGRARDDAAAAERHRQDVRQQTQSLLVLHSDLTGFDLRGRDLSGFYLRARQLEHAQLDDAILNGANLSFANLRGASLARVSAEKSAYLEGAVLVGTDLEGARLAGAYMRGADLTGAFFEGADLAGADLSEADLRDCDLSKALNVEHATFESARYDGRTAWPGAPPDGAVESSEDDDWLSAAAEAQAK